MENKREITIWEQRGGQTARKRDEDTQREAEKQNEGRRGETDMETDIILV